MATVLSARQWEESLVTLGRRTGAVRIVGRAYRPHEICRLAPDLVVIGEETAWLNADIIGLWRALGIEPIVVGTPPDAPVPITWVGPEPEAILAAIQQAWLGPESGPNGQIVSVVGPSGSGVTEIACALATLRTPCRMVDLRPPDARLRLAGTPAVDVSDSFPVPAARGRIVVDCGTTSERASGACFLVVAASPAGYVRAHRLVETWLGPVPELILNMVHDPARAEVACRQAVGLEPSLVLPYDPAIHRATAHTRPVPARFLESLAPLISRVDGRAPR